METKTVMNAEFFAAIEDIEKEKGIPRAYMYDKIRQAMLAAFRRDHPENEDNVAWILENTPLKTVSIEDRLPAKLRGRTGDRGYIQLVPGRDSCDGFFMARFIRPAD